MYEFERGWIRWLIIIISFKKNCKWNILLVEIYIYVCNKNMDCFVCINLENVWFVLINFY